MNGKGCEGCAPLPPETDGVETRFSDETGDSQTTVYPVFPGICLKYNDAHMLSCHPEGDATGQLLEITHCREGRVEFAQGDEFCYLTAGDLAVTPTPVVGRDSCFPMRHYHGITVSIRLDVAPACLSCLLQDVNVRPQNLYRRFCENGTCYIARSDPRIEHIFSELYSVPPSIRCGYYKVKVLELLLFLSTLDTAKNETPTHTVSQTQVELARRISLYLSEHMETRVTIDMLSRTFHVSGTGIKNCFRAVYGVPLYTYIRTQKMQTAAYMLRHGDLSVLEIAGRVGYDNGSKFAGAFRDIMGVTPLEYRNGE